EPLRQGEDHVLVMAVESDVEAIVGDRVATKVETVKGVTVQKDTDGPVVATVPILLAHQFAVGAVPPDISNAGPIDGAAEKIVPSQKDGVRMTQRDQTRRERQELAVGVFPIDPRDLVVLTVRVIVATLRASDLVAGEQHGDPL